MSDILSVTDVPHAYILFRQSDAFRVCAFMAAQIPFLDTRAFPQSLAGPLYEEKIPIFPEEQLSGLISRYEVDFVFLAYSDLAFDEVIHTASLVQPCGAAFAIVGTGQMELKSGCPLSQ